MTTSATGRLGRKLEDIERATFLELFFDVVFIFALRALTIRLLAHLNWSGAFHTLLLLMAIGLVWSLTVRATEQLDPQRPSVQLLVIATMIGALVLSAAIPQALGKTGLIFAVTYLAIQLGRSLFLRFMVRGNELHRLGTQAVIWHAATGVPWLIGAAISGATRTTLWTLAVGLIYIGQWFGYPLPGFGRLPSAQLAAQGEYLGERFRQLFIMGLGEVIVTIGVTLTNRGFTLAELVAFVVTFNLTALMWRIYIFHAGEQVGPAIRASATPDRLGTLAAYAHLIMVAGLVVTSASAELVINHPLGHSQVNWTVTILAGPALFLAGRALLEYIVFNRVSKSRVIGLLALLCLAPPTLLAQPLALVFVFMPHMPLPPPLVLALANATVFTGIVIAENMRARTQPAPVSPLGPHRPSDK